MQSNCRQQSPRLYETYESKWQIESAYKSTNKGECVYELARTSRRCRVRVNACAPEVRHISLLHSINRQTGFFDERSRWRLKLVTEATAAPVRLRAPTADVTAAPIWPHGIGCPLSAATRL
ncbi:hypothetical protein DBV15_03206 [Temnothorax longispinosus]|uniref:Uncharacterized protein n=1 Tax=Temnothorax longispinosus TaxID=300112 RepID=A0A4S2L3G6_9HYME|nr:hypothetical protein DBV15_03206 [Temnothorax longispinosus]